MSIQQSELTIQTINIANRQMTKIIFDQVLCYDPLLVMWTRLFPSDTSDRWQNGMVKIIGFVNIQVQPCDLQLSKDTLYNLLHDEVTRSLWEEIWEELGEGRIKKHLETESTNWVYILCYHKIRGLSKVALPLSFITELQPYRGWKKVNQVFVSS